MVEEGLRVLDEAEAQSEDPADTPRAWWFAKPNDDGSKSYRGFDESMQHIRSFMDEYGPFDGVFGFSQGACLAATLTVFLLHPELHPAFADGKIKPLRFVVCCGGFPDVTPERASIWSHGSIPTPSLHIVGRGDGIVGEVTRCLIQLACCLSMMRTDRSLPLVSAFENARLEYHDGGHFVVRPLNPPLWSCSIMYSRARLATFLLPYRSLTPAQGSWRSFLSEYISSFDRDGPASVPSPSAPRL